jgi:dolichol-phosphate mannosyltransferase
LQDPPELIEDFYRQWQAGYDVVYGVRVRRETTFSMGIAYKLFYRLFRRLSYIRIPLDAGDFSLMDRRVVDQLNALPERNRFMRGLRAWVGFPQTGVPYVRPERMFGRSTNNLLRNLGWARKAIVSFSYAPIDLITGLGFLIVGLTILGILGQVALRLLYPSLVMSGFSTLIILILFMGGVQLLSVSVIGSYIAHIYDEVKRRPAYIVDDIRNLPGGKASHSDSGAVASRAA